MPDTAQRLPADRAHARAPDRARRGAPESLVLLTRDRALLATVRAVSADHAFAAVSSEGDLADRLAAAHAGVAIIDAAATTSAITDLTQRLAAQFPELALVVAGDARDQGALTPQITSGLVHRFLHKPVSEQRVRLFVEAAWRRHEQDLTTPVPILAPGETPPVPGSLRRTATIAAIAAALVAAIGAGAWFALFRDDGAADAALYRQAASSPSPQTVEFERLIGAAEQALAGADLDEAERLAAAARALDPSHASLAFLDTRIGKERERELLARAREAASTGNVESAIALLEGAELPKPSTIVAETQRELEARKLQEQLTAFLERAEERAARGALLEPARDNARFLIQSALALAPEAEEVRAAQARLGERLLEAARASLAAADLAATERWLEAAQEMGADAARTAELRRGVQRARASARAAGYARLAASFDASIEAGRLLEPAADSAKHWLGRLVASDPANAATQAAQRTFAARLLAEGRAAAARQDLELADTWLAEARAAGAGEAEANALAAEVARARQAASVVDASVLERVRYVEPRYPDTARARGSDGWVTLEFTVKTDGSVGGVTVTQSEPAGVFDGAAISAVRKWRYRPVTSGGAPVEQRARLRIRFALE